MKCTFPKVSFSCLKSLGFIVRYYCQLPGTLRNNPKWSSRLWLIMASGYAGWLFTPGSQAFSRKKFRRALSHRQCRAARDAAELAGRGGEGNVSSILRQLERPPQEKSAGEFDLKVPFLIPVRSVECPFFSCDRHLN